MSQGEYFGIKVRQGTTIPLFPLPDVVLFPGVVQPFRIFEPRYLQLIGDVLDTNGLLVMGTVLGASSEQLAGSPTVEPLSGLGRIEQYQRLEDGKYLILLRALARVWIHEVESDSMYRKVTVHPIEESVEALADAENYREQLREALHQRAEQAMPVPDEISISQLIDLVLMHLKLAPNALHRLYSQGAISERARDVLAAHVALPG